MSSANQISFRALPNKTQVADNYHCHPHQKQQKDKRSSYCCSLVWLRNLALPQHSTFEFLSKPSKSSPVQRVFILRVVKDFADTGVRVQKLPLNVRRVDRLDQKLCLQKHNWDERWKLSVFENLMNRKSSLPEFVIVRIYTVKQKTDTNFV